MADLAHPPRLRGKAGLAHEGLAPEPGKARLALTLTLMPLSRAVREPCARSAVPLSLSPHDGLSSSLHGHAQARRHPLAG
jgi:hypothetical protein